ncbi:MAG: dTDP-4-dehydrorhamnose 3,5-epimerase [Arenicellales bacterium]
MSKNCVIEIEKTALSGVVIVKNKVFGDERGFFMETFNQQRFESVGLPTHFVQDNHSRSSKGVLRGLHYQYPQWQGKLVRVLSGAILDVAVDIRPDSKTYGDWVSVELNDENRYQLYIPPGFAHGFATLSDTADVAYKCTTAYKPEDDAGILWNDPDIGVEWPLDIIGEPQVSEKDANAPRLADIKLTS